MNEKLVKVLFKNSIKDPKYYETIYPRRNLVNKEVVTRIAPSPTGFIHLGNLYNAIIGYMLSTQSNGVFFLRIEDTDKKREVSGAIDIINEYMNLFEVKFTEGVFNGGDYKPYIQSERKDIYAAFAKELVLKGLAYPDITTEEEISEYRTIQEANKEDLGYYGKYAKYRSLSEDEYIKLIENKEYVLRFKASSVIKKIYVKDLIRKDLTFDSNYQDFVLLKPDGLPTYHFAHVVDDYLMGTTHVIRGEEWLSSLPYHIALFEALNLKVPYYIHTPVVSKMDGDIKRKLSKRKDPELALTYYLEEGYPIDGLWIYLLSILNSNFEEWLRANKDKDFRKDFIFTTNKMSGHSPLFDKDKLNNFCKDYLSIQSPQFIYDKLLTYCKQYNIEFYDYIIKNNDLIMKAISLGRTTKNKRKDFYSFKTSINYYSKFFDDLVVFDKEYLIKYDFNFLKELTSEYLKLFSINDSSEENFNKIKELSSKFGYSDDIKAYKENPNQYKGVFIEICDILRTFTTGSKDSPDIQEFSKIIGVESLKLRFKKCLDSINL